ncbi:hypothetical protein SSX86_007951 [Deinandra increscens subsp. villosa]|uniref:Acyl carrier protein n=1 Tax=Deinandra increscens subsp. villosa TaxID=3103831 RepID=A0AAP0DJ13_9ASTR
MDQICIVTGSGGAIACNGGGGGCVAMVSCEDPNPNPNFIFQMFVLLTRKNRHVIWPADYRAPKGLFPPEPKHYQGPKLKVAIIGAGLAGMSAAVELLDQGHEAPTRISGLKMVSFSNSGRSNLPISFRRLQISRSAKPETVEKVCSIVRKQLALKDNVLKTGFLVEPENLSGPVEIVMGLEEEFGITVEEESAHSIATIQDAADLTEKLVEKSGA